MCIGELMSELALPSNVYCQLGMEDERRRRVQRWLWWRRRKPRDGRGCGFSTATNRYGGGCAQWAEMR